MRNKRKKICSFCKDKDGEPNATIVSCIKDKSHICSSCVAQCVDVLSQRLDDMRGEEFLVLTELSETLKNIGK